MSVGKEYTMLFQLNAQVGGGFSGTFGKAQQHIMSLQKEIVALNKTQGDISAYQKQEKAIESTKNKLAVLQQQYDNIQREIQETGEFSSDLENKLLSKQMQIDKTSASLDSQTQKLNEMGQALKEAGVNTGDLANESDRLKAEVEKLKEEEEEAADGASSFGEQGAKAISAVAGALAAAGITEGLHEIAEAYMECVGLAADFEETMSTVRALSSANAGEIEQLSAKAKELGASTKFTAEESAQAMSFMAMAGWDATEMLSGMDGVLSLAAASGEDLAAVSDIVTDNLTAFGLKASDTAHFADVLAAAATNSNTSVSIMGETFKNSAAVAGALGYSIDDVAVAVGLMANAGIKGSNAGTALRNVFTGLLGGVTLTSEAFGELEYSAINADGSMKPFSQTLQELRGYFDQMTGAEKAQNAQMIAGQRAFSGFLAILNATEEDYASLASSIENCTGAAEQMATIKLDNLRGDVTLLQSAWDALKVTIGEQFNPEMRETVQIGTEITTWLNEFAGAHPAAVRGVMAFVATLAALSAALIGISTVIKVASIPAVKAFAASLLAIPGAGPILAITAGVAALVGVLAAAATPTRNEAAEIRGLTEASRQQYEQLQELNAQHEEAVAAYGASSSQAQYLAWQIDQLSSAYENGKQSLADYVAECDTLNSSLSEMLTANRNAFNEAGDNAETTLALTNRLQELSSQTERTVADQEEMRAIIAALNSEMPDLALSYEDAASSAESYIAAVEAAVKAQANADKYQAAQKGMTDAYKAQSTAQQKLAELTGQREAAAVRAAEAERAYLDYLDQIGAAYDSTGGTYAVSMLSDQYKDWQAAANAVSEYDAAIDETEATLAEASSDYARYKDELSGIATEMYGLGDASDSAAEAFDASIAAAKELAAAYTEAYNAALSSIQGQYALWDEASEIIPKDIADINGALESQASYWTNYNSNLQALAARTGDVEGLSDVIASFADGSAQSVNAIAGMANATDAELQQMVANWQAVQAEQKAAADSLALLATDFENQMSEIESSVVEAASGMDASSEAAASAQATLNSFISSANAMLPRVQRTFSAIGAAAGNALGTSVGAGGLLGRHYASGTDYAPEGLALVGEEGPELVYLNGGEQIKNTRETQKLLNELGNGEGVSEIVGVLPQLMNALRVAGNGVSSPETVAGTGGDVFAPVSVSVTFQIEGNANADTVERLNDYGDDFSARVLEVMEQAGIDSTRRRY